MTPAATFIRRVIRIKAVDSPNVRLMLEQQRLGLPVTHEEVLAGVLSSQEYLRRRKTMDAVRQCVALDAEWWEGADALMYPPDWLNRAERIAQELTGRPRKAEAIGCDPAEGGDSSCWSVIDRYGLLELISLKTPNTTVVTNTTIALMQRYGVPANMMCFDRGGGGKQHADQLRERGYPVRTVAFGESVTLEPKRGLHQLQHRKEIIEERYTYRNRRAQMYDLLRTELNPDLTPQGFGLPARYTELRRQLAPIPLKFDREGEMYQLPKNKRDPNSTEQTLTDLIGRSPDEADSLVIALYAMKEVGRAPATVAGVL